MPLCSCPFFRVISTLPSTDLRPFTRLLFQPQKRNLRDPSERLSSANPIVGRSVFPKPPAAVDSTQPCLVHGGFQKGFSQFLVTADSAPSESAVNELERAFAPDIPPPGTTSHNRDETSVHLRLSMGEKREILPACKNRIRHGRTPLSSKIAS
ncbi:hypothetical protein BJY00DRAFT_104851 [Aspergillus carlsbadensis]|nr:hypothetical protein BJY00DRAFT_104851 [Aspergillus carlsbadensis]